MANAATISTVSQAPTIDTVGIFKGIASACSAYDGALAIVEGHIETLKKANVKFGKSKKTCQYRVQLGDAMKSAFAGKAEKTYANYVTAIVASVNDGVKFSFSASKGKGKGGASVEKTDTDKMVSALLNVWKLSDIGTDVLVQVEQSMADGTPLIDAIVDVLKFHGVEFPAE
jgi:hypothetical protein